MSDRELLVRALDRLAAGDWDGAHDLAQRAASAEAAWLHAHLYRVEGDPANAAYRYRRAGRPIESGDLEAERRALLEALR